MPRRELLRDVRRIVVKIGTSTIAENGLLSTRKIGRIVDDVCELLAQGYQVTLVSSGAIAGGLGVLQKKREMLSIPEKQAMAAVGQVHLMDLYRTHFSKRGYQVGQILLTEDDVRNRKRYLNARHTFNALLNFGVIPIVNENDSVVIKEIKFGENDTLSAHVANIIEANLLVLLSDVDGFYWNLDDPEPVSEIYEINDEIRYRAGGTGSEYGSGGMFTKIKAAEMIIRCGEKMIIANGAIDGILMKIVRGEKTGTLFIGTDCTLCSRKRWLAFSIKSKGSLIVDTGALNAICRDKKSLLASGIVQVNGSFAMGDAVEVHGPDDRPVAKGIVNYNASELQIIKGKRTDDIRRLLGDNYFDEVINRDDLIVY